MSLEHGPAKDKDNDQDNVEAPFTKHTAVKVKPRKPKKEESSSKPISSPDVDNVTTAMSALKIDKEQDDVDGLSHRLAAVNLSDPSERHTETKVKPRNKVKKEKIRKEASDPTPVSDSKDKVVASSSATAKEKQDDSTTEEEGHRKHTETKIRKPPTSTVTLGDLIAQYTELKDLIEKQQKEREGIHTQGEQIGRVDNNLDRTDAALEEAAQDLQATLSCGKAFKQQMKKIFCCCCTTETPAPQHDIEFDIRHPKPLTFQFSKPQSKGEYIDEIARMAAFLDQESKKEGAELDDENAELKVVIGKSDKLKDKTKKSDSQANSAMKL